MKNKLLLVFAAIAAAFLFVPSAHAQLKQGPEYTWRAQVCDFGYTDTITSPKLVAFPIQAFFRYDIQAGSQINSVPSGPDQTPPKPDNLTVDLIKTPTTTVTFTYNGKQTTLEYGAVVACFAQLIADQRALQKAQ